MFLETRFYGYMTQITKNRFDLTNHYFSWKSLGFSKSKKSQNFALRIKFSNKQNIVEKHIEFNMKYNIGKW